MTGSRGNEGAGSGSETGSGAGGGAGGSTPIGALVMKMTEAD